MKVPPHVCHKVLIGMSTAVQDGSLLEFFVPVLPLCSVGVEQLQASFVYVLINEDGHNGVRVVRQGRNVVQHLDQALARGYLMRTQQQRCPTRTRYWLSHDVKGRPDARCCCRSFRKQAQIWHNPMKVPFHSDKRCSHTVYVWVSSEIRQPAPYLIDAKGCAILRLILDRWMRSILLNVTIVDLDAKLPVLHPTPCFKHLSRAPLLHSFLSQPQQSCPAQPAPVLPADRRKTRGVVVPVLRCAPQAQDFVSVEEVLLEVICRSALWSAFQSR